MGTKLAGVPLLPSFFFLSSTSFQCTECQEPSCVHKDDSHTLRKVEHEDTRNLGLQWNLGLLYQAWMANDWNSCYVENKWAPTLFKSLFSRVVCSLQQLKAILTVTKVNLLKQPITRIFLTSWPLCLSAPFSFSTYSNSSQPRTSTVLTEFLSPFGNPQG